MKSFHVSYLGAFGSGFKTDRYGYVHMTVDDVSEAFDCDEQTAEDIAEHNATLYLESDTALTKWRKDTR